MNNIEEAQTDLDPMYVLNELLRDPTPNKLVMDANRLIAEHDIMIGFILDNKEKFVKYLNKFIKQQEAEGNLFVVSEAMQFRTNIQWQIDSRIELNKLIKNFINKGENKNG